MSEKNTGNLIWRDGVPVSKQFDDPYYSHDGGLDESWFVFYEGAEIEALFGSRTHITIGETGFGTGLNFLATWQKWREGKHSTRMTFISAEAFPLSIDELEKAHANFPQIAEYAQELRDKWPPAASGFHLITFADGAIELLLMFGDARDMFSKLHGRIDAWYLDGFAPTKNPEMWRSEMFTEMARLSKQGATLATFTAAGFVRRGLTDVGFNMQKTAGFGRKRERLVGSFAPTSEKSANLQNKTHPKVPRWSTIQPSYGKKIAVIGAGIGGLMTAAALQKRGINTQVYRDPDAGNTSANLPAAILAPKFGLADTPAQRFQDAAFIHAVHHPVYASAVHPATGTKIIAKGATDTIRLNDIKKRYDWPQDWVQSPDDKTLFLPKAKTLSPSAILERLCSDIRTNDNKIQRIEKTNGMWQLQSATYKTIAEFDTVVLAMGIETTRLLNRSGLLGAHNTQHPELRPNAGQIETIDPKYMPAAPETALSYGGYLTAAITSPSGLTRRSIGATFERLDKVPDKEIAFSTQNREKNLKNLERFGKVSIDSNDVIASWSGLRATVADHMPFVGPIPDWQDLQSLCAPMAIDAKCKIDRQVKIQEGLYIMAGLGSKGFQYAPLLSEYLSAMITDEPLPLPTDLVSRLHPARGFVRNIIRSNNS